MLRSDFTYLTHCKGEIFNNTVYKLAIPIRNNSNYCIFYKGNFIGEVRTKKDAEAFIGNLIRHNKLTYTQEF